MKRIAALLLALVLMPTEHYDPVITLSVVMDTVVTIGHPVGFTITTTNADTVSYAFWSQSPDSTFWKRTEDYVVLAPSTNVVNGTFQTCVPGPDTDCQPDWLQGPWEFRISVWRWVRGYKYEQYQTIPFVVQ